MLHEGEEGGGGGAGLAGVDADQRHVGAEGEGVAHLGIRGAVSAKVLTATTKGIRRSSK